jgi:zona occludens toxin
MINAIVGRPRTGKSYEAVRYHIIPTVLKDKRKIVTNIPVNLDYVAKVHGQEVADLIHIVEVNFGDYKNLRPFSHEDHFLEFDTWKNENGQGVFFVIDEVHLTVPKSGTRPQLLEYYSLHGHYGHDHLILTQNARKIHNDLKDMTEIVWRTSKLSAFGQDDSYLRKTHHGFDNLRSIPVHTETRQYDKEWFPYYKSHTLSKTDVFEATAQEVKANMIPYKKTIFCMIVFPILFLCTQLYGAVFPDDDVKKPESISTKPIVNNSTLKPINESTVLLPATNTVKKVSVPKVVESVNDRMLREQKASSKKHHPFHKVQLHIDGFYEDTSKNVKNVYFSASSNGQKLFNISMKDLILAGYMVRVLGPCIIKIEYFDYSDFLVCDVPTIGVDSGQLAITN